MSDQNPEDNANYKIKLAVFEGPLDILLHLIKKNEIDIFDIPITQIVDEYLDYIQIMKQLNLIMAGEFIAMAAMLIHIKSKMLLPKEESKKEEEDPRAELVRRLLEYKRFKEASENFSHLESKRRDFFTRPSDIGEGVEEKYIEATLYELIKAFKNVLTYIPKEEIKEIAREEFDVEQKTKELLDKLKQERSIDFNNVISKITKKGELIATFLALLEIVRLKLVRVYQGLLFENIKIVLKEEKENENE